jgi:hypothetical protein
MEQLTKEELKILVELLKRATTTVESATFALQLLGKLLRMLDTPKETQEAGDEPEA